MRSGLHVGIDLGTTQLGDSGLRRRDRLGRSQRHRRNPDPVGGPHRRARRADGRPARAAGPGRRPREHARRVEAPDGHGGAAAVRGRRRRAAARGAVGRGVDVAARGRARRAGVPAARGGDLDAGAVRAAAEPRHRARRQAGRAGGGGADPGADRQRRRRRLARRGHGRTGSGWSSTWAAGRWTYRCWRRRTAGCASSTTPATTFWAAATSTAPSRSGRFATLARRGRSDVALDRSSRRGYARLRAACEQAKIELSRATHTLIALPEVVTSGGGTIDVDIEMTRADLDGLTAPFIARALSAVRNLLDKNQLRARRRRARRAGRGADADARAARARRASCSAAASRRGSIR